MMIASILTFCCNTAMQAQNAVLTLDDVELKAGEVKELSVNMTNPIPVTYVGADIILPEGCSFEQYYNEEDGEYYDYAYGTTNYNDAIGEYSEEGKIAFAAVKPNGSLDYNTTANGYGFWFDSLGNPIGWGSDNDSKVYVEYDAKNFSFSVGQYPGKLASGDNYIVKEALVLSLIHI